MAVAAILTGIVACSPAGSSNLGSATATAGASSFTDPFAYCAAVGTVDAPDQRYVGPPVPQAIAEGVRKASGASPDAPLDVFVKNSFWRCMDGKVYGCFVGANLPCSEKAKVSRTPTAEEVDFCKSNPNADVIPAVVTGHETVYEWRCTNGAPMTMRQVFTTDERGFIAEIWYRIENH